MSTSSAITATILQIASQLPVALILLVGLVLALMNLSRLPKPAMAAGAGVGVLLLMVVVRPVIGTIVSRSVGYQHVVVILNVMHFFFNLIEAAALGALIYAVFADRPQATSGKPLT